MKVADSQKLLFKKMFTVALLMPFYFYNKATIVIYLCGKYNYVVYQGIIVTYLGCLFCRFFQFLSIRFQVLDADSE